MDLKKPSQNSKVQVDLWWGLELAVGRVEGSVNVSGVAGEQQCWLGLSEGQAAELQWKVPVCRSLGCPKVQKHSGSPAREERLRATFVQP